MAGNVGRIQVWMEGDRIDRNRVKGAAAQVDTTLECLVRVAIDDLLAKDVSLIKQMVKQSNCAPSITASAATTRGEGGEAS